MSRTLTSGIAAAYTDPGAYWGLLVSIALPEQTLRFTTLDTGFSFGGFSWAPNDIAVSPINWAGGVARPSSLTIGDPDRIYWTLALTLQFANAPVHIYGVYADAPTEAVDLWAGRASGVTKAPTTVQVGLSNDSDVVLAPRTLVQAVVNPVFLLPAGTILNVGNQRWIIDRPT